MLYPSAALQKGREAVFNLEESQEQGLPVGAGLTGMSALDFWTENGFMCWGSRVVYPFYFFFPLGSKWVS